MNARANAKKIKVGDHVLYKASDSSRLTFTSKWDPKWIVLRVQGPLVWIKQQKTSKHKTVNRDKVVIVDQQISWEEVNPIPVR